MAKYEVTIFDDSNNVIKIHNTNGESEPKIREGIMFIHDLNGKHYGYKSWGRYTILELED